MIVRGTNLPIIITFDEDATAAQNKGEAKFHEILADAAVSNMAEHSAILFTSDGFPLMHQCYKH